MERIQVTNHDDGTTLIGANCDDMYHGGNAGGWTVVHRNGTTVVLERPGTD